jgi:hypothetical protein
MVKPVFHGVLILEIVERNEKRSFLMPSFVLIVRHGRVEIAPIRDQSKRRCALLAEPILVRTGLYPPVRRLIGIKMKPEQKLALIVLKRNDPMKGSPYYPPQEKTALLTQKRKHGLETKVFRKKRS